MSTEIVDKKTVQGAVSTSPTQMTFAENPDVYMEAYAKIGGKLQHFVKEKGLSQNMQGKDYPLVEAWTFLYTTMGMHIDEGDVFFDKENGWFIAEVFLIDNFTNQRRGRATAICGDASDGRWHKAAKNHQRSMAITRAIGKVGRENFPWMMKIAGLQPTPAEEMPQYNIFDMGIGDDCARLNNTLTAMNIKDRALCERAELIMHGQEFSKENIKKTLSQIGVTSVDGTTK